MSSAPHRVKLITIDGLFRQYDHRIPLHLDERVTVLHGRNGVGKTVTLSLVAALLKLDYVKLAEIPFDGLRVDFTDESSLCVKRGESPEQRFVEYHPGGREKPSKLAVLLGNLVHQNAVPFPAQRLLSRLRVHFIEAQRLFRIVSARRASEKEQTPAVTSAMTDIAREMAARIQEADSTYRSTSTRLDDSLPARLFAPPKNGPSLSKKELARRTEALEAERRRLHEIGLLPDTTSFNPSTLNDIQRAMFAVYLEDNEEKLAVFKDLADRAEILLGTLNRKLAPKQIKLDKDAGYRVTSHDGRPLELDHLSSGEQHELVLLHNLLFRVEPGALLLIDEPELSLHVTWQAEFLAELIQIAKKVGFDALVATHSPYIVGDRRDLMVRLGEPV